jgi:SNF2 family DNA or RNA helicase
VNTTTLEQPPIRGADSWQHQLEAYHFAVDKPASLLAMAMGTGKSKVAIDLLTNWSARRVLILCPVSVRNVWRREFRKWAPDVFCPLILETGTVKQKAHQVERAFSSFTAEDRRMAVVVNYESAWRKPLGALLLQQEWDCVVLDESHRAKAHSSRISKYVQVLADKAQRRLCLTGTPLPHSPLDVFGQYRFLDWRLFGKRWTPFKHSYGVPHPYIQNALLPNAFRNLDILKERFGRIAYQVGADVLDLPPVSHHTRTCTLPPMAAKIYADMERDFFAEIEAGVVTAANVLVKSLRLRQVVSGFIQPDGSDELVDVHDGKTDLLRDLLTDLGEPCVVSAEFRYDLRTIRRTAEKLGLVYGEVSGRQNDLTEHATIPDGIDVLGVQYQSGGVGVDLSRVRYCILYSPTYSLGNHDQFLARVHRPGQEQHVHYYYLVAEKTIDELVYKALRKKREIVDIILSGYSHLTEARQLFKEEASDDAIIDKIEAGLKDARRIEELEGLE